MNNLFYVHPLGLCESGNVGKGARIWAFAHVLPRAVIGEQANICDHCFIENDVILGDRVTVKCHVALWDGLRVEDDVFVGPSVVFANDKYPRSKCHVAPLQTWLRKGCSVGAGAVILPGVQIGVFSMVAAGAVVTKDVPPFALVSGNPAKVKGSVCICGAPLRGESGSLQCSRGNWKGVEPTINMKCDLI